MKRFITEGEGLPRWQAPVSHAVVVGDTCYLSGQLSVDEDGTFRPGSARAEAARAFGNLFAALRAAGFAAEDLVFVDICCIDLADLDEVNAIHVQLFAPDRRPARTIQQSAALPYGGRVKVAGVAVRERR